MPRYEFMCEKCQERFEQTMTMSEREKAKVKWPTCKGTKVTPQLGGFMEQTSKKSCGKTIHAWAVEGDCDPGAITSHTFSIEWPPRSGTVREFPEIDRAAWFALDEARERITKGQRGFLDQLRQWLGGDSRAATHRTRPAEDA